MLRAIVNTAIACVVVVYLQERYFGLVMFPRGEFNMANVHYSYGGLFWMVAFSVISASLAEGLVCLFEKFSRRANTMSAAIKFPLSTIATVSIIWAITYFIWLIAYAKT